MKLAACIFVKVCQIIATVAATCLKKLSDKYSERLLTINNKRLSEWMLLNTISLTKETDELSVLTFVGYTFISTILLLSRIKEKDTNYHITEIILLSFGILFFTLQGLLIFGVLEQLPDDILSYGYSLGTVSFICAILFAIDLFFFRRMAVSKNVTSQTDLEFIDKTTWKKVDMRINTIEMDRSDKCCLSDATRNGKKLKYLRTDL
ncbi:uncharacterized protein LOC135431855 [Drosophila montana]|uniref:uncharacterized protein LOC135431855 n=1 Tax=Drosophila montana TaxID=40370 RepID=UPI00313F0287